MAKIIWSPHALDDIRLIHDFIARDSINQANLLLKKSLIKRPGSNHTHIWGVFFLKYPKRIAGKSF